MLPKVLLASIAVFYFDDTGLGHSSGDEPLPRTSYMLRIREKGNDTLEVGLIIIGVALIAWVLSVPAGYDFATSCRVIPAMSRAGNRTLGIEDGAAIEQSIRS